MTLPARPLCVAFVTFLLCGTVNADVAVRTYKSPDAKWQVLVGRMTEVPSFNVTVKQGDKPVWSYHPNPKDKSVHIFWRPDSTAFLMEHVTLQKEYRLYLINVAGPHLNVFPISFDPNLKPASIVDGTVKWDIKDEQGLFIKLTIEDLDSKKRELLINQDFCLLESMQIK